MGQIRFRALGEGCRYVVRPVSSGYGDVKTVYGSRRRPPPRAGLIVETNLLLDVGALVELDLVFADQPFTYRSRGYVSWVFENTEASDRQLGVTITSMDKLDEFGVSVSLRAKAEIPMIDVPAPPAAPPLATPVLEPPYSDAQPAKGTIPAGPLPAAPPQAMPFADDEEPLEKPAEEPRSSRSPSDTIFGAETREAVQDVFDILSMLLPEGAAAGGLEEMLIPSRDGIPNEYEEIIASPAARIDFAVHVPGHGQGRFCYLTGQGAEPGITGNPLTLEEAEDIFGKLTGQRVNIRDAEGEMTADDLAALTGVRQAEAGIAAVIGMDEELASVLCSSMRQIDSPAHFPTAPIRIDTTVLTHEALSAEQGEPTSVAPAPKEKMISMVRISQMPAAAAAHPEPKRTVEERLMTAFQRIEGLYDIRDQDQAAAYIVELARELVPCGSAACAFICDGAADLYIAAATGVAALDRLGERIPAPRGFLGFAIRSGQIASVTEPARIYPQIDQISRTHVKSVLAAPVTAQERALGAIELLNAPAEEGFSNEDGDILAYLCQSLGEHIVQSIEPRRDP